MLRELFGCKQFCREVEHHSEVVFSITRDRSESSLNREYASLDQVDWQQDMSYMRIQKSRYSKLVAELHRTGKQFTDPEFPPTEQSIGTPPSRSKKIIWKRVRDFVANAVFFDESADSPDTPIGNSNDCYLLPTITALFERGANNLQRLFSNIEISQHGIYMMRVNFMGVPQEVIVDDYFPVYEDNKAVFAKPREGNEVWEMVLEKVWAKLRGSYSNIQSGLPHEVMTTFSHAPCFFLDLNSEEEKFVWLQLQDACHERFPTVASSRSNLPMECAIRQSQTYSILGSYELQAYGQIIGRVVKLACPTEMEVFESQYHPKNSNFWSQVNISAKKAMGFDQIQSTTSFFMSLTEFVKYFDSVDLCHMHPYYNYNFERGSSPTGSLYFEVELEEDGETYFTLHQQPLKSASSSMLIYGRMIMLVAKMVGEDYHYVTSKMEMNFPNLSVRCPKLTKGRYIVYTKCYRKVEGSELPSILAVYSSSKVTLKRRSKQLCASFLQRVFLNHAYANSEKTYLTGSKGDWVCAKMLYNEGGFAYIAAHVQPPTNKRIRIGFDSKVFEASGFQIKEPFSHIGRGQIVAEAGKPCIMVCRLMHHLPKQLVFPPEINIEQTI